ncbi:Nucleotidyltransferase domain-containing protein OS=Streptomyces tendae OX=1932 GN=GUR47_12585 PE=4 SV=1 [Streptomyces tendae]
MTEAQAGRFGVEPLMFHLAGIPTYLLIAELAINKALRDPPCRATRRAWRTTAPNACAWYGTHRHPRLRQGRPRPS